MKISNTKELVDLVNSSLGDFCQTFAYRRKELARLGRAPARDRLFEYDENSDRDWAINQGGGTEIQFHLFVRDNMCGYGLGFNAQYVPFNNDKSPKEYMLPFAKAYMALKESEIVRQLKNSGFGFQYGKEEELTSFKNDYYLFGKVLVTDANHELLQSDFDQMIADIKGNLFSLYCAIFELKNKGDDEMFAKQKFVDLLYRNYNLILTGAPGTGKTHLAFDIAREITSKNTSSTQKQSIGFVQFHPSYDYTDFVEGLRPTPPGPDGNVSFIRKDGAFKAFCKDAQKAIEDKFVFIIDEINRGDIAKIFGELFFAIDPGYRDEENPIPIKTQYQNLITDSKDEFYEGFVVPKNVYIIGTMNDIDRNVESMDFAIRRRFTWRQITPEYTQDVILAELGADVDDAKKRMDMLNASIRAEKSQLGENFCIGAAYFRKIDDSSEKWDNLWNYHLKPLLEEYVRGLPDADKLMKNFEAAYNEKTQADANTNVQ